ncbi:MAG: hypothetical protein F4W90_01795 [Gammaproteobacteria bacterium]|nr:hypothetical protein [Gammaproteobacteria bacterium]
MRRGTRKNCSDVATGGGGLEDMVNDSSDKDIWSTFQEHMESYDSMADMLVREIQPRRELIGQPVLMSDQL